MLDVTCWARRLNPQGFEEGVDYPNVTRIGDSYYSVGVVKGREVEETPKDIRAREIITQMLKTYPGIKNLRIILD